MDHALIIDRVTKRFGQHVAVNDLSLEIPRGSIHGFLGPNGAGKTTTLRMVMSILMPDSGSLRVLGQPDAAAVKDRLGYLPEEKGLYKKMKAGELLAYFGMLKGIPRSVAKERAKQLLTEHGLGESINKRCEALSKGMGQKVQVLATLIHEPELVILDEPFSGLDPVNADLLREVILQMKNEGRTVIFSTHVMEQAEQLCDFIVLINKGEKVIDGPLSEVRRAGGRSVRIDYEGRGHDLDGLPGVTDVNDLGKTAELFLDDGADTQALLRALTDRVTIRKFDLTERSLHEIFKNAVGGEVDA